MALPLTITGPSGAAGFAGPFKASNGSYYFLGRPLGSRIQPYKATDPSSAWAAQGSQLTVSNSSTSVGGSIEAVQEGDILHVATCTIDSTTATSTRIYYHKYSMASQAFTLSNELVDGPTATSATTGGDYRSVSIIRRSASVVIAYQMPFLLVMSANYSRVGYRERTDAAGTWSAAVAVDAIGAVATSANHIGAVKDPQTDRIHFHWIEGTASPIALRTRTLSAANAFNTASTLSISITPPSFAQYNPMRGTAYVSGGVSKIVLSRPGATTAVSGVYFNSADNPTVSTSSGTFPAAAAPGISRIFADNGIAYLLYLESASQDLFIGSSSNHGATWSSFTLTLTATIDTGAVISSNGGQVYVRGSNYVVPYVVDDFGTLKYNEYVVRAAAPAEINVTTGSQTALATTQSAMADADLQVSADQNTLAVTQTGTIQAQEVRAVTGAQTTPDATQSATAGVMLAVTTGTQTTSAVTQAAAADVDAKVTGAQNTSATAQTATADVDLAVTGAQTTSVTTQAATASAAVRNVTAAQATLATTQSATAGIRLTVTGAQTLAAPTQAAAADVDLAVTGAQGTLATTQVGTVGLGLAVTGAQTLSAATQTATATVRLAVTAAQTTRATTQTALVLVTDSRLIVGNQTTNATTVVLLADVDVKTSAAQTLAAATSTGSISSATQTKTYVRHAGVWKQATPYVRHAGVWKAATIHVKHAGSWKRA